MVYKDEVVELRNVEAFVLTDAAFPIIIGLGTIRRYDLTQRLRAYFTNTIAREQRSQISATKQVAHLNRVLMRSGKSTEEGRGNQTDHLSSTQPSAAQPSREMTTSITPVPHHHQHQHPGTVHQSSLLEIGRAHV